MIIIGSGQYNWDVIKLREYPEGFPYTERVVNEEVGGTCSNVMCMLSRLGWDARPQVKLIDDTNGLRYVLTEEIELPVNTSWD